MFILDASVSSVLVLMVGEDNSSLIVLMGLFLFRVCFRYWPFRFVKFKEVRSLLPFTVYVDIVWFTSPC